MSLTPITQLLRNKIIPYTADEVGQRIIIARPVMEQQKLPVGVELQKHKLTGRRVITKAQRLYANSRLVQATWPTLHLHEATNSRLICVTGGRVAYPVGDSLLHLTPGLFVFIPPGVPHPDGSISLAGSEGENCELFHLMAYPGAVQCWSWLAKEGINGGDPCENFLVRESKTVHLFRALAEEVIEEDRGNPEITGHLMQALFRMLLRDLLAGRYLQTSLAMTHEKPSEERGEFSAALHDYIRHHLHLPLTLEMAASHMFLSRAQFARRVKSETGKTFVEILTEYRLENAKMLLRESEWSASIIAEMIGLKSMSYFNHLFMRYTGSSPSRYRQIARKSKKQN